MPSTSDQFDYNGQLVYRTFEYRRPNSGSYELQTALPDGAGRKALGNDQLDSFTQTSLIDVIETSISNTQTQMPSRFEAYRLTQYRLGEQIDVWISDSESITNARRIESSRGEVVLLSSNRVLIRGTKKFVAQVRNRIERSLVEGSRLIPIEFDPEFMLWIFVDQHMSSSSRFEQLSLIRLNGASFVGDNDAFGEDISLKNTKLADSSLAHTAILSENKFEELSGLFELNGRYIQVKIQSSGRVHVRAAEDLRNRNMAERFVTASQIVDQLAAEYLRWLELPRDEQYPPARFFRELDNAANEQGIDLSMDIEDMLERYAQWRGESLEEYLETE